MSALCYSHWPRSFCWRPGCFHRSRLGRSAAIEPPDDLVAARHPHLLADPALLPVRASGAHAPAAHRCLRPACGSAPVPCLAGRRLRRWQQLHRASTASDGNLGRHLHGHGHRKFDEQAGGPDDLLPNLRSSRRSSEELLSLSRINLTRRVPQVRFLNLGLGVAFSPHTSTSIAISPPPPP